MRAAEHSLQVTFESAEAFQREYAENLVNGGVFVPTEQAFKLFTRVQVELVLAFSGDRITMAGEVVHRVAPEMARMGAPAGVAVQFDEPLEAVRKRFEPLCATSGAPAEPAPDPGQRQAPRAKARVTARVRGKTGQVVGHTRDLSRTGVLVSVPGEGIPVGEKVRISLSHPTSGKSIEVDGVVARDIQDDSGVSGLGIAFEPAESERAELERFVEGVQSTEHTRRLGGITGDIAEFGVQNLFQMFSSTMPTGTLALQQGQREGVIGFDGGELRFARLGRATGLKALVRLLAWSEGHFEFHASLDSVEEREEPMPLQATLVDAARLVDEGERIDRSLLPAAAKPRIARDDSEGEDLSKVEAAVLDLVRAGFTVQRMVDVIPEPDPEIYRALLTLSESGAISF